MGDNKRLMNVTRIKALGWKPKIRIEDGIKDTVDWFLSEGYKGYERYNAFKELK